jgi:hypothetical protein
VGEEHHDEQEAVRRSRDREEVGRHDLADVIRKKARHLCDGGWRRRPIYFATVA